MHNLGGIVVLDPGTVSSTSSCYMPAADTLQIFSGSQTAFDSATFPVWLASYPSSRFGAVISAGTSAGVGTDVSDAAADRIGNVYIDDETGTPTYATPAGVLVRRGIRCESRAIAVTGGRAGAGHPANCTGNEPPGHTTLIQTRINRARSS